ncbi:MAG: hypothetical protein AB1704_22980 [Pseudomonadota bacterium]|uniref:hypothetical protein n=3 Tax=Burkholderiaceae TaxID=119060 RepID=UPI00348EE2E4
MAESLAKEEMRFDPEKTRETKLRRDSASLKFLLDTQHDASRPMGNVAQNQIGEVINACLVGLHKEVFPVVHRSNEWLDRAIEEDEEFGVDKNLHRRTLHWARGIGEWLETGWNAEGSWDNARVFEEAAWRYEKRPWPANEIVKSGLGDYMAFAYLGGECNGGFDAGIDTYERWVGPRKLSLNEILTPYEFGYLLCLHREQQLFDEAALFAAGRRMLQANLEETWLGAGQYIRAATWLKIVYCDHDSSLTPLEILLRAYDNMPKVPRPKFL